MDEAADVYEILDKQDLTSVTKQLEVRVPAVARKARPGQFVVVRADERGERIPLTIADADRERGTLTLVVQEVGKTTMQINAMQVGDRLASVTGPLGKPAEIRRYGTVLCIAGGFAVAPTYPVARALKEAGLNVAGDPGVGHTETHQVVVELGYCQGVEAARLLEENNIIVNFQASPRE